MDVKTIAGRSAATAATANHAGAALWNPSTAVPIWVVQISWMKTVATADNIAVTRISARGTAGSSITSVLSHDNNNALAPASGAILDLATYSAQPTLVSATAYLFRANMAAAVGAGFIWNIPGDGIKIPPGAGLALVTPPATILQPADVGFAWRE